jgi:hypothetical protein
MRMSDHTKIIVLGVFALFLGGVLIVMLQHGYKVSLT